MASSTSKVSVAASGAADAGFTYLSPRHEWMVTKLCHAFSIPTEKRDVAQKCVQSYLKKVNQFLTDPTSPPKLFFFYQPRQLKTPELFLSTAGDGEKLEGKCAWFLRNTADGKPVNTKIAQDATVLCGEMTADILQTFEGTLSQVYAPMLRSAEDWGQIKREKEKKAFVDTVSKFDTDLKRKIANLRGDLELRTPDAPHDAIEQKPAAYAKAAREPAVLEHFQEIVSSWCENISKYMEDDPSNVPLDKSVDHGPDVEIEYWSRRMLTLISITEQLKTKPNRVVTGVLKARALRTEEEGGMKADEKSLGEQENIKNLIEKWREVDLAITDALNEAKDNVRFLENLRKVIEPLYNETPSVIADSMPTLMNSMKMIHTLSRHYGTDIRMTNLFELITNQLINRSKEDIYGGERPDHLWTQSPDIVISKMNAATKLFDAYRDCYRDTKQKLAAMPKGKQFSFDEAAIFGKFTRFCRRLEKLIDMFSSIKQFQALKAKRIDGMDNLITNFQQLIDDFRTKAHDLLDFHNTVFERDFVEFTMKNSGLENAIQDFMEHSLAQMSNIDKKLELMKKFQEVLTREALQDDLEQKYLQIFRDYGEDLKRIQNQYERNKDAPPIPRNMTRIAGNIQWSRQLLRRITSPIKKFVQNPKVFHPRESKKIVERYNKLAKILIEFETLYFQAWVRSTEQAKRGLRARLIVPHASGRLQVNFDAGVLGLMREAKHLELMGKDIPNAAKIVLLLEEKLKNYYNQLNHVLDTYARVCSMVSPVTKSLLRPHLRDLENAIRPALVTMTWTSMNIEAFLASLRLVLSRFENLVIQINDIMVNRIQKNLDIVSSLMLLSLPGSKSFGLRDFAAAQQSHIDKCSEQLEAKNLEIEHAVDDLIAIVVAYPLDKSIAAPSAVDMNFVKLHYSMLMYNALLTCTKSSLQSLKKRIGSRAGFSFMGEMPLFTVDLSLQSSLVTLSPSLEQIHDAINGVAVSVLNCTRKISDWGLDPPARPRARKPFAEKLSADKTIAVVLLLLTGAVEDTKMAAATYLMKYNKYRWLWTDNPEDAYAEFVKDNNRILEDFVAELGRFMEVDQEIADLPLTESLGSLSLRTENLKTQLRSEQVSRWTNQYSERLHQEAKRDMEGLTDKMHDLKSKLERDVKDFASLKFVMDAQAEIREVHSWIDQTFDSIIERYNTLERYLPHGVLSKDEMDAKSVLRTQWNQILTMSTHVMTDVNQRQEKDKKDLFENVRSFKQVVQKWRDDYDANGPMVKTSPQEAITRLAKYKREFESLYRKYELYNGGEKLFGLPEQKYPELIQTKKELGYLDKLYNLYEKVLSRRDDYNTILWSNVIDNINEMNAEVQRFSDECSSLPKNVKEWEAFLELSQTIEDLKNILPLLTELSKPSMRDRHWKRIAEITKMPFDWDKFHELKLKTVLDADLLSYEADILEITNGAEEQLSIERKLLDIQTRWDNQTFEFAGMKERGEVILAGESVQKIIEQLEESQASLIQMLTQRHSDPFKDRANMWLKKLSEVNDALEGWIRVQMLWMSLEAVFTGGDIARQMPQDTRVFTKVDKEWTTRLMTKAKELKNVVDCCQNEYIKNMLPTMFDDLERCQKALDGYLEAKRSKFPRFYFVSNPSLLIILSQGSDKEQVQDCFAKVFDSIDRVEFAPGNNIVKFRQEMAGVEGKEMDKEEVQLAKPVKATGNIEDWLNLLLKEMQRTMKNNVRLAANDLTQLPFAEFIAKHLAQVTLLGIQVMWTTDVTDALQRASKTPPDRSAVAAAYKKQLGVLSDLSAMTTTEIKSKMERIKVETLVTIQVHQRDVLETLVKKYKEGIAKRPPHRMDVHDFEWQKQMRCYWLHEEDECVVKIADVETSYCYEYLGCKERLVVTGLTDRCYISLSQAMGMHFGGAPAGPAGTGKTETVKDLARAYGKYVVVFNCGDQWHTGDTAKLFKGLCQSGSWGCFDEFNRIELDVLSVVAQQVQAILTAMRGKFDSFLFPGDEAPAPNQSPAPIPLDPRCGVYITMNPTYAGRQELPENLKALFRGVAMMVPDRETIIKVKLASVGYENFPKLAVKFRVLYNLCEEQLSKQKHYDFGLRNILSVLRTAGVSLRSELRKESKVDRASLEEMLMMRTLRDMNLSKLVADDVGLFISLLHDLFPDQRDPEKRRYDSEEDAMRKVIADMHLIHHDSWVTKCIQLYETSLVRHGLMMVGPAGGGKSTAIKVLLDALTRSHSPTKFSVVRMNPKAIKPEEMFGKNDPVSGEWTHGVFSRIWAKYNDMRKHNTWIVCDGPVDTNWIENLNTVLDDNKLLTLANGDRVPMTDNVRLLFEVENLRNASPATVSRAGIIFVSSSDLGFAPLAQAWLASRQSVEERTIIDEFYHRYVIETNILDWLRRYTRNAMIVTDAHVVTNTFNLLEGLLGQGEEGKVHTREAIERFFIYSMAWGLGGLLEQDDRVKFSDRLRDLCEHNFPQPLEGEDSANVFDYYVQPDEKNEWLRWTVGEPEIPTENFNFSSLLIPTVDSVRAENLVDIMLNHLHKPILVIGGSGTAKTSIVLQYTRQFDAADMLLKKVNFSSATTAGMFQTSVEADVERWQGRNRYAPPGGRWMTVFLDDLSMPEVNKWGDQPTLEIVRQLIESGGFYFLEKEKRGTMMLIEQLLFVGSMNHPGGGRNDIPNRLKRHFFTFNMPPPSQASIDNIYGSMLRARFDDLHNIGPDMVVQLTGATIDLWQTVKAKMLPTPSKFHYVFNMRDLSRVFQGVLFSPLDIVSQGNTILRLWKHECERVFSDKLTNEKDKKWYQEIVQKVMASRFGDKNTDEVFRDQTYFVDFLRDETVNEETDEIIPAPKIYEPVKNLPELRTRVDAFLAKYNDQGTQLAEGGQKKIDVKPMQLVLFHDALEHLMRISRILGMPRGNALLVGVGGSGRQSLTRLAAYIANHDYVFQLKLTRGYKLSDFTEALRQLYTDVGKDGKKVTWVLTDFEIVNEDFLEYVNAILTTGEIATLFTKDERDLMSSELRSQAEKQMPKFQDTPDELYRFFLDRIRDNLHIVLCFSPANDKFAERARRFPGLISGCMIDWFLRWPEQALVDVSYKFLMEDKDFKIESDDPRVSRALVRHIANVHNLVSAACGEYMTSHRREVHVTPKSYLSFIKSYKLVYKEKVEQVTQQQRNIETGLSKLKQAERDVDRLKKILEQQNEELKKKEKDTLAVLAKLEKATAEAKEKKAEADIIAAKCLQTEAIISKERAVATRELEQAMPYVHQANKAAKSINKKELGLIQRMPRPPDLIKRIMDCVLILSLQPLERVSLAEIKTDRTTTQMFIGDSYETYAKNMMAQLSFVSTLVDFAAEDEKDATGAVLQPRMLSKDSINEETMEFLEPYLNLPDFTPERARVVSQALESLCKWVRAMASYHNASLMVGPKLEALQIKTNMWTLARTKAERAKAQADDIQAMVDGYTRDFKETMKEQEELRRKAAETQEMMARATALINSLSGEKRRWNQDLGFFADSKNRLVGDCALACAFVSYLGPFNYDYRRMLIETKFYKDCASSGIPVTKDLNLSSFLVDEGTIAEWNSQGLPKDDLSTQNGILVTQASRFPLLIDPQGQALSWLMTREAGSLPIWGSITLADEKLADNLAYCLKEGKPLVIEGITKDVDPLLDPVLEKSVIMKGRQFYINLGDKSTLIDPNFRLYLITKLSNPQFSPELSAKTTIIDFSVTQQGLEDQLLSLVIQKEQRSMEEQRQKFNEEVNMNTISLQSLDKQLLERLAVSQSNLLEDAKLIEVLADTKVKAQEVKEKLNQAHEAAEVISKRRESYRAVATRGSVLYFVIVSMAGVNCMYQTSLAQFLVWFDNTMVYAEKANLVPARVENLKKHLTYSVYTNINRGLFEADKLTFKLMIALKVLLTEEEKSLTNDMITLLLKAGTTLSPDVVPKKPFEWLQPPAWTNVYQLSSSLDFFADLKALIEQNPDEWHRWYEHESPESQEIPKLEERLQGDPSGAFMRFLVIRCFRDDRTRLAAQDFISSVLGKKFVEPLPTRLGDIFKVSDSMTPIILLLTPGADPTSQLEELARRHKPSGRETKVYSCSMGQGQKPHAQKCVSAAMEEGSWALLQNCHLGLGYMEELCDELKRAHDEKQVEPGFRLWITCEPHVDFPINLLQMSIKVTNEPPRGMQAGLLRSYTAVVDTERLTSLESVEWRNLVFTLCFLHSAVQERRKFGPVGWCIPYEFNTSDLEASLTFLEKTLTYASSNSALSWPTIQYMICEVQYGGRITDDQDRNLFNTFGKFWLTPQIFSPDFCFAPGNTSFNYCIPAVDNIEAYRKYIETVPGNDPPEIFGLHGNAELTFGAAESNYILNTIADTQPKEGLGGSKASATGAPPKTRDEIISDEADKLLKQLPKGYIDEEVRDNVRRRPREEIYYVLGRRPASDEKVDGFSIPLNVFLYQEITRLNATISNVRKTLQDMKDAIKGDIMLTPDLLEAMNAVYDMKPPKQWYLDANRQEIAWTLPSLGAWFNGLLLREQQLTSWLMKERPAVFWLTGFFNPQGFLTAMRQEVNRRHANDKIKWALDDVVLVSEVTDYMLPSRLKAGPDDNKGVYIYGLFLEGAGWDRKEKMLVEAQPKELYVPLPILCVTPETSSTAASIYAAVRDDVRWYDCPVYTKPKRTDSNLVFSVKLRTSALPGPQNSPVLRGVALLCSKE